MSRHLPNLLTLCRLLLSAAFFAILNQYRFSPVARHEHSRHWLIIAMVVFIIAALTDWLDGYLARKWKAESTFGRIMDPFCDKVLVLGAFIYLSGPRFVDSLAVDANKFFTMVSGVYPWMVALMLARELLVTGVRAEVESHGIKFGAVLSGKLKMILQSVGIPVILFIVYLNPSDPQYAAFHLGTVRDVLVYAIVIVTLISGFPYIASAARSMRDGGNKPK
jgi:CDP-diacylglycerol--glycerol-3-phosphate 3-phosphatidyltransferase